MYSKIQLHLSSIGDEPVSPILSFSHYLAHIELFQYTVVHETDLIFSAKATAFFMHAMQHDKSCGLYYLKNGSCFRRIPAGTHKMLVITFRPDWAIHKLQRMKPINLYAVIHESKAHHVRLPSQNVWGAIFRGFTKLMNASNELKRDDEGYIFVNSCLSNYYQRLLAKNNTMSYYQAKAEKVKNFIDENFHKGIADDLPKLAEEFMLSERSLDRIARIAFGIPLHEHVIKLRINASLQQLKATNKPVYEIARQTGYNDPHYFSKAFKKHVGISPKYVQRSGLQLPIKELKVAIAELKG